MSPESNTDIIGSAAAGRGRRRRCPHDRISRRATVWRCKLKWYYKHLYFEVLGPRDPTIGILNPGNHEFLWGIFERDIQRLGDPVGRVSFLDSVLYKGFLTQRFAQELSRAKAATGAERLSLLKELVDSQPPEAILIEATATGSV